MLGIQVKKEGSILTHHNYVNYPFKLYHIFKLQEVIAYGNGDSSVCTLYVQLYHHKTVNLKCMIMIVVGIHIFKGIQFLLIINIGIPTTHQIKITVVVVCTSSFSEISDVSGVV